MGEKISLEDVKRLLTSLRGEVVSPRDTNGLSTFVSGQPAVSYGELSQLAVRFGWPPCTRMRGRVGAMVNLTLTRDAQSRVFTAKVVDAVKLLKLAGKKVFPVGFAMAVKRAAMEGGSPEDAQWASQVNHEETILL